MTASKPIHKNRTNHEIVHTFYDIFMFSANYRIFIALPERVFYNIYKILRQRERKIALLVFSKISYVKAKTTSRGRFKRIFFLTDLMVTKRARKKYAYHDSMITAHKSFVLCANHGIMIAAPQDVF